VNVFKNILLLVFQEVSRINSIIHIEIYKPKKRQCEFSVQNIYKGL